MLSLFCSRFRPMISQLSFFPVAFLITATAFAADNVPERCLKCHSEAIIVGKVVKMPAEARAEKLETFLTGHFAPDAAERAAIVAALKAMAEKR